MTADDFPRMDARTASHGREGEDGDAHGCASPQSSPERDRSDAVLGLTSGDRAEAGAVALSPYPENDKLAAVAEEMQTICDFIENGGWLLCKVEDSGKVNWVGESVRELQPVPSVDRAVEEYFGINHAALERERRAMLEALRG